MAIEFETQPAELVLSGNQVPIKVKDTLHPVSEEIEEGYGTLFHVKCSTPLSSGSAIIVYFYTGSTSFFFYYGTPPSIPPPVYFKNLRQKDAGESTTEYYYYIIDRWAASGWGAAFFYMYYGSYQGNEGIFIKSYNDELIKVTTEGSFSFSNVMPVTSQVKTYGYVFELTLLESLTAEIVTKLQFTPDLENNKYILEFDIKDFLGEDLTNHFTIFPNDSYFSFHNNLLKKLRILVHGQLGTESTISDEFKVLQGKIPDFMQAELNELSKSFYQYWCVENKKFLTMAPAEKTIDIYIPERLYFLNYLQDYLSFYLVFKIYYTDGTDETQEKEYVGALLKFSITELNVAFLAVPFNEEKVVKKYEIWIRKIGGSGEIITEVRTYIMSYKYQPYARYFLFKNKLGMYEVIRITGKSEVDIDIDKQIINVDKVINYTKDYREEKQTNVSRRYSGEFNSGYFENEELAYHFLEFLESGDVYWLKKGKAYPVTIPKLKIDFKKDGEYLKGISFPLNITNPDDELYNDFTFDPEVPIGGDFNFDFNEDFY